MDTAKQSVRFRNTGKLKGGEQRLKISAQFTRNDAVEAAYFAKMTCMSDEWYPDCWVAFLRMERSVGEDKVSPMFHNGLPTKISWGFLPTTRAAMRGGAITGCS